MAVKVRKLFARLFVGTRWDPAIVAAGNDFELMWYRMIQWGKEHPETRGFIPRSAIPHDIGRGIRRPAAVMNRGCIAQAMHEGDTKALLVETDSGWQICTWASWQETPEEIEHAQQRKHEGAQITNHKLGRHKSKTVADCPICQKRGRYSERSASRSSDRYSERHSDADIELDRDTTYPSSSRTDGPEGGRRRSEPTTPAWPRYDEDWYYDQFRPTDYLLNEHHREEGGWWPDHTSWVQPAVWRDGWNGKGKRPPKGHVA